MSVHIERRRDWSPAESIFLLGPGGVGKSSLGAELAPRLGLPLIDLDTAFCDSIGVIGRFISNHGYHRYRAENLELAHLLLRTAAAPVLLVTSSGFLAAAPGSDDNRRARALVATGYGIALLPSLDIEVATPIVVERQLRREFGLERATETRKFRERFGIYRGAGEMCVASVASPGDIAEAVERALRASQTG